MADRSGLTAGLSAAMAHTRVRVGRHDPGITLAHLAVMLADGGDCMSDLAVLRNQPGLFGPVASDPTAWRTVTGMSMGAFAGVETARAGARARVWAAGLAPATITLDFDATLVTAHSEKQDAAPTYKRGFGFHPLMCTLDETGEALAAINRPGNAGANDAADHVEVLDAALAQLPVQPGCGTPMLARADSAGATHAFLDALRARGVKFSVGFDLTGPVRDAVLAVADEAWIPARKIDGDDRDGAWVAELANLNLAGWPAGPGRSPGRNGPIRGCCTPPPVSPPAPAPRRSGSIGTGRGPPRSPPRSNDFVSCCPPDRTAASQPVQPTTGVTKRGPESQQCRPVSTTHQQREEGPGKGPVQTSHAAAPTGKRKIGASGRLTAPPCGSGQPERRL